MNNKSRTSTVIMTLYCIGIAVVGSVFKTEFCNMEVLQLTCPRKDELLVVKRALYGRMERGRCVKQSYDVGCGTDVTAWVEDKCSGRRSCEKDTSVPDTDLYEMLQCSKESTSYLQTLHQCVQAVPLDHCKTKLTLTVDGAGFLSPHNALRRDCMVKLVALDGQKINLTLYDFGGFQFTREINNGGTSSICLRYAHITEEGRDGVDVCRGRQPIRSIYLSHTSSVDIAMSNEANKKFLFHFKLVGCGHPKVPPGVDVEVIGASAVAVCNLTGEKTHLICKDVSWVGSVNPCISQTTEAGQSSGTLLGQRWSSPVGLVIVVASGIAIGTIVGVCALLLFAFCFVRKKNPNGSRPAYKRPVSYDSPRCGSSVSKTYLQLSSAAPAPPEHPQQPHTELQLSKCTLKRQRQQADGQAGKVIVEEAITPSYMADTDKMNPKRTEMDYTQKYETSFMARV